MIDQLNILLRKLITTRVAGFGSDDQVRFQLPDDDWRTYVKTLSVGGQPANALNLYLVDLRENRKLRSNERIRTVQNGDVTETTAPRRIDCHYLISAWSPADVTPAIEPTLDEHAALYDVASTFSMNDPLIPTDIYAPGPVPPTFPPGLAKSEMPITLLPPEGFIKLAEFWGTMGDKHRWKPVVYLIVTLPILPFARPAGPIVTTAMFDTRMRDAPATSNTLMQFGGTVRASGAPNALPVAGAWVDLLTVAGVRRQLVRTDSDGRFLFVQVAAGSYQLRISATGLGSVLIPIEVPAPGGSYEVHF